jgi:hypothetical protein
MINYIPDQMTATHLFDPLKRIKMQNLKRENIFFKIGYATRTNGTIYGRSSTTNKYISVIVYVQSMIVLLNHTHAKLLFNFHLHFLSDVIWIAHSNIIYTVC